MLVLCLSCLSVRQLQGQLSGQGKVEQDGRHQRVCPPLWQSTHHHGRLNLSLPHRARGLAMIAAVPETDTSSKDEGEAAGSSRPPRLWLAVIQQHSSTALPKPRAIKRDPLAWAWSYPFQFDGFPEYNSPSQDGFHAAEERGRQGGREGYGTSDQVICIFS